MGQEEELLIDKLASGDRPSITAVGMIAARALKQDLLAVFMVDEIGRVHLMPPTTVEIKKRPALTDKELHLLDEAQAIQHLISRGESEQRVVEYLRQRDLAHEDR